MLVQGQILQGEGSTIPIESHHTPISAPSTSQPPTSPLSIQITHVAEEAATMPYDSALPRVHSLGSDEGSMTLNELIVLCTTLSKKVEILESDLKQTKLAYGAAYTKLIMKVKKLEHKGRKIAQIDEDKGITLVQMSAETQGRHEHDFEEPDFEFIAPEEDYITEPDISTATAGAEVSTASPEVKTATKSLVYIRRSAAKRKDKGKTIMKEAEPVQKKTKLQLEQERIRLEEALRLQEQLDEEERQRITRVHKEASTFNAEEWDNIQAQIEADEELAHMLQAQEREDTLKLKRQDYFSKRQKIGKGSEPAKELKGELSQEQLQQLMIIVPEDGMNVEALQTKYPIIDWEVYTEESRMYWMIIRVVNHTEVYQIFEDMLKNFDRDDLVKLWSLVHERFNSTKPTKDKERELWVELKRLFEPDDDDILWKLQRYMHDPLKWRLYDTCAIHHVSTERGHDIFMLIEKNYPLTRALMTLMLSNKLWFNSEKLVDLNDNHKFRGGLLGIKGFYNFVLLVQLSTAKRRLSTIKLS
ncbi:hypothetical protein Tco_1156494 [Tanacetum coccineum]